MSYSRPGTIGRRSHSRRLFSTVEPRTWVALFACIGAVQAGAIGYFIGDANTVDGGDAAELRREAFANSFEQARRDAIARGERRGEQAGERAGTRAGHRAGERAGAARGAAAVERERAEIAAALAAQRSDEPAARATEDEAAAVAPPETTQAAPAAPAPPAPPASAPAPDPAPEQPCFDAAGHPC